jgi:hypothetical protein
MLDTFGGIVSPVKRFSNGHPATGNDRRPVLRGQGVQSFHQRHRVLAEGEEIGP